MEFGQLLQPYRRLSPLGIVVFALMVVVAMAIGAAIYTINNEPVATPNPMRVTANRAAVEPCLKDQRACIGGFVKFRGNNLVLTIVMCGTCQFWQVDARYFRTHTSDEALDRIEYIALYNDQLAWERAAVAYARQWVDPSQKP